ncbi:hypothetical protein DKX38_015192 [Salix brachista]|uniref:dCTP pyrophosphatase 1 n=1 Tax=Salix brachista TaxID=2182728 RepID=A0A5N5L4J6_9ROSI|nr:hypothetical protein DKX38_015192 [Salix brachista]
MEEAEEISVAEEKVVDIGLKDLAKKLEEFAKARDWEKYHSPRNLLLAMVTSPILLIYVYREHHARILHVGEVGELSEIFQWRGEVDKGLPDWEESDKEHLAEELSDVLLYLIRLSDICGIDLGEAATKKIVKNAVKYPPKAC